MFLISRPLLQGHKRAPSDISIASSEDEKIPLSPSNLESVPERMEPAVAAPLPKELTEVNHVVDTGPVEEPATPGARGHTESTTIPAEDEEKEEQQAEADVCSPETEAPAKEIEQLALAGKEEKEVDMAEATTERPEESNTQADEKDQNKHPKVTLTLPVQDKLAGEKPEKKNGEKPAEKETMNTGDEKTTPDKAKDDKERDADSAADNSSVDLNLSISSFLSKTKEPGSVSIQVTSTAQTPRADKRPHDP